MNITEIICDYGMDTLSIAVATLILTGIIKTPLKFLADKSANSKKITRFVTFLPIFIGFGLTVLCTYLLTESVSFNKDFYVQWLSSVSLSLAIYAFWEKFVQSEKKILSKAEIVANKEAVEQLKSRLADAETNQTASQAEGQAQVEQTMEQRKIILSNNKNLQ